jgi:hypothetical protein
MGFCRARRSRQDFADACAGNGGASPEKGSRTSSQIINIIKYQYVTGAKAVGIGLAVVACRSHAVKASLFPE